jgi:hypothetical protein
MTLTTTFHGTREELDAYAKGMNAVVVAASEVEPHYWSCLIMGPRHPEKVTLTHVRGDQYVTVLLGRKGDSWQVVEAVDEEGSPALLTAMEHAVLRQRAEDGEDETGR